MIIAAILLFEYVAVSVFLSDGLIDPQEDEEMASP